MPESRKALTPLLKIWLFTLLFFAFFGGASLGFSSGKTTTYESLKNFSDILEYIEKDYVEPVDGQNLIDGAIEGLMKNLDPHSELLSPEAYQELQIDTRGEFAGVGIQISMRDGFVTVIAPIEDTPASKAGILTGDRILRVDDKEVKGLEQAVKLMRGPKKTKVTITLQREGEPKELDFTLTRELIAVKSVKQMLLRPGYGYIRISHFKEKTSEELEKALKHLEKRNSLQGLILDLRNNPGGLLPQAVEVADLFLEEGKIVSIKGRKEIENERYEAQKNHTPRTYPLIVLVNGGSASASEIVAGCFQDNHRALILGTTSFGKGSVQTIKPLANGYGLKLTIARYYTPSGRSIQSSGIKPDVEVQYRDKELNKEQKDDGLRERDLENHLRGRNESDEADGENHDSAQKRTVGETPYPHSRFSKEALLKDNQVARALELLENHHLMGTYSKKK